ncbi:MAG: hypothetical protein BWX52_01783 [Bacteroidetes bacterium ADurb.Bin013]|jgi:hypothetical protein|nr:MAG: hypothetical protein BWX52_01783 [Bacteroidetes bacterium ADurb.Bin013]
MNNEQNKITEYTSYLQGVDMEFAREIVSLRGG